MLGSSFFRSKPPLQASRLYIDSTDSLSISLDPSWILYHVKRIIFQSNRSFDTSTPSLPYPDKFSLHQRNSTHRRGYIERDRQFDPFAPLTQQVEYTRKRGKKKCEAAREGRRLQEKTKSKFWVIFLSRV